MSDILDWASSSTLAAEDADDIRNELAPQDMMAIDGVEEDAVSQQNQSGNESDEEGSELPLVPLLCGVCDKEPPKYKCPKCYLPYCSVACNKVHREEHPPGAELQAAMSESLPSTPPLSPPPMRRNKSNSNSLNETLASSDQLQYLFRKYPLLKQQLLDIIAWMNPPEPDARIPASMRAGMQTPDNWSYEKGLQKAIEALRKMRDGADGEGVQEYCELVLYFKALEKEKEEKEHNAAMNVEGPEDDVARLLQQLLHHGTS